MNELLKSFAIKIALTIPALLIGIMSALLFLLKPLIELWSPKKIEFEPPASEREQFSNPHHEESSYQESKPYVIMDSAE